MGSLMRSFDWSQTPLGPAGQWPQSLRTAVSILLTSRYSMWMGWGPDLTFIYNDAYKPTLGIKHPWALGVPAREVWAEIWRDVGPRIETVLSTGQATYDAGLLLLLERSGFPEETYHAFSYSPLLDDDGNISGMLCVVTEETGRTIGERRMALLRELASDLAGSKTEGEVLAAVRRRIGAYRRDLPFTLMYLFDNDAGGRARLACATGIEAGHEAAPAVIDPESSAGIWPGGEIFHAAAPILVTNLSARIATPLPTGAWDRQPAQAAIVPVRKQGQERPAGFLVAAINPYRRYDETYAGFIALLSGQVASALANARAYEEERKRAEALAEIDRAKTAFFSNVSHEFRTPLTLLLGPVEDLLAKPESAPLREGRELLSVIHRNGLRLQRLVNTLLDFSRIEAGRAQAVYIPVDLAVFTAELASGFRSTMERAGLQFTVECPPLSQPVYVDREMWEKVVLNLLSNAFKYTLSGSVLLKLAERGDRVELSVTDTGEGIPGDELPRLFERFHRVEGTRGRTHEGTGIGLALVRELVKLHNGSVSVTSTVGQGSTFTVSIPFGTAHLPQDRLEEESPSAARALPSTALHADAYVEEALQWLPRDPDPQPAASHNTAGPRSRVLLADDNVDMRDYVRRLLESRYEVTAVSNGEEALAAALAKPPDLVLTDVMMPVLDGFELLKTLRSNERTRTLPIILLSARAGEESRVEGLDAGADDYLVKPFTARELLARVEAHISLARMRRQAEQARQSSELRLGLALEATDMAAWEWDPVKDAMTGTGGLPRIFGVFPRCSSECFALIHPEDEPAYRATVERVAREGGAWLTEFRIRRADTAALAWVEERATSVTDETGRVLYIVGVDIDITNRKIAEQDMRRRNEELERANSELEEFAYVASHDLQEPLRTVNIYTELLLRRLNLTEDKQANEFAGFVHGGVNRMGLLIRDLLSYARVVHPEQELAGPADLNRSLEEALNTVNGLARETGAAITHDKLPVVHGHEPQIAHVFQNLLSNALKYRRESVAPRVHVSAQRKNDEWVVSVSDNGIGFDAQYAERIFGLFKRLHRDDRYTGTGLGLAICKRIVERYGGRIWAESEGPGRGATISFTAAAFGE